MTMSFFGYGPLAFEDAASALSGGKLTGRPASVQGYQCSTLSSNGQPGMFPAENSSVEGVLFEGITENDMKVLEVFYDSYFEFKPLTVTLRGSTETVETQTWIIPDRHSDVMVAEPWNPRKFEKNLLPDFVFAVRDYRRQVTTKGHREPFTFDFSTM